MYVVRFKKTLHNMVSVVVLASLFGTALTPAFVNSASAISGSDFNAGHIIDDAIFTNNNAMTSGDIQNFLEAKESACDTSGSQSKSYYYNSSSGRVNNSADTWVTTSRAVYGQRYDSYNNTTIAAAPYVCLKDYYENTSTHQNNLQGHSVAGGTTAAQIIKNAADAYNINPQVILTTLQKEQGLVTDDWPWTNEYSAAMGYACPDTGNGCSGTYAGFAKQVSSAAWQFRYYLDHPNAYNYWIGNYYVQYNPNSGCGGSVVNIQNAATAALYIYTPYQPNAAALNNLTGTGDGCSAYGNRNFWYYFNTWFGSSIVKDPYSWAQQSRGIYTDSGYTNAFNIGRVSLTPGQKAYVRVIARNSGSKTWTKSTYKLGTSNPNDRASIFADNTWLSSSRIALQESSVAPGDTGTFLFTLTAPDKVGSYREYFNMIAEGQSWFNDIGMNIQIDIVKPQPMANTSNTRLNSGDMLKPGQYLLSPDTYSTLNFATNGMLKATNNYHTSWTNNKTSNSPDRLVMQTDGNLVEYAKDNSIIWQTSTSGHPGAYLTTQADGNIVLYSSTNAPLWATGTNTNPDHLNYVTSWANNATLYAGQMMRAVNGYTVVMQTDGNLVEYNKTGRAIWASNTSGNIVSAGKGPGTRLVVQSDGNLVLYNASNQPIWATNTAGVGNGSATLMIQMDGNLVAYSGGGGVSWATNIIDQ